MLERHIPNFQGICPYRQTGRVVPVTFLASANSRITKSVNIWFVARLLEQFKTTVRKRPLHYQQVAECLYTRRKLPEFLDAVYGDPSSLYFLRQGYVYGRLPTITDSVLSDLQYTLVLCLITTSAKTHSTFPCLSVSATCV